MGVPKFYRWLSERYPLINQLISDETLLPEFDNLYLDMNGILHNCSHPGDGASHLSDRDIMLSIFSYIDRIVTQIVRPKKILFLAVDGCAPRAKLNQQRSRRFRSAKDAREAAAAAAAQPGGDPSGGGAGGAEGAGGRGEAFDSNCITPGTAWMAKVSRHLQYFVRRKIKEDPLWQRLTVIYSGMEVPGEGEHKIMNYIRHQRAAGVFPANCRHCMYGQDADLVMLGLITHEPHFTLLREVIDFGAFKRRSAGGPQMKQTSKAAFQLLHLSVLREYLALEFSREQPQRTLDPERLIDDFVFMTFLVGNDFLPHMPSLDIGEHAFDRLFGIYRSLLAQWGEGGYLTDAGKLRDPDRLEQFLKCIGDMEDEIFAERAAEVEEFKSRRRGRNERFGAAPSGPSEEEEEAQKAQTRAEVHARLQEAMGAEAAPPAPEDMGFKVAYYMEKLGLAPNHHQFHDRLRQAYIEGLIWCLAYYYEGCVSWGWFYPYHYGPLISDLTDLRRRFAQVKFDKGQPFTPFFQLLGCLPAASGKFLPAPYRKLMTEETSPIIDFYPEDFKVDANGKRNPWEAVNLLPFIDADRMRAAVAAHCPDRLLTEEERRRNRIGPVLLYHHDPANTATIPSCNPEIGLPDLLRCASSIIELPTNAFEDVAEGTLHSALRPGVTLPLPGYPSLATLPRRGVRAEAIGLNCFGSGSRYQTLVLDLDPPAQVPTAEEAARELLGRTVFVNWPNLHEALVVGAQDQHTAARREVDSQGNPYVTTLGNDLDTQAKWAFLADDERRRYLGGRGVPGTGGADVGPVALQLAVRPLQGMRQDPLTGRTHKVWGAQEAQVPYQLALRAHPAPDPRFREKEGPPLPERVPVGARVVFVRGAFRGLSGQVEGHDVEQNTCRVVVEERDPEPPFGLNIARSIQEQYVPAPQLARALGLRGDVFGKVVGSVRIEPGRIEVGLNLKWNGQFQLLGYSRCLLKRRAAWKEGDAVKIVGTAEEDGGEEDLRGDWQFSRKAGELLVDYQRNFPQVFHALARAGHARHYSAEQLLGPRHEEVLPRLQAWLAARPTAKMPRSPLATEALGAEAVRAVQRAADVRTAQARGQAPRGKLLRGVAPDAFELASGGGAEEGCGGAAAADAEVLPPARPPQPKPALGMRVCSLARIGVPFGLWGTVVAIHPHSACVEVVFDAEFLGGGPLGGLCAPHRGKLLPWAALLPVGSNGWQAEEQGNKKGASAAQTSARAGGGQTAGQQRSLQVQPKASPQGNSTAGSFIQHEYNPQQQSPVKHPRQQTGRVNTAPGPDAAKNILGKALRIGGNAESKAPASNPASSPATISMGKSDPGSGLPSQAEITALMGKWQAEMNVGESQLPAHHPQKHQNQHQTRIVMTQQGGRIQSNGRPQNRHNQSEQHHSSQSQLTMHQQQAQPVYQGQQQTRVQAYQAPFQQQMYTQQQQPDFSGNPGHPVMAGQPSLPHQQQYVFDPTQGRMVPVLPQQSYHQGYHSGGPGSPPPPAHQTQTPSQHLQQNNGSTQGRTVTMSSRGGGNPNLIMPSQVMRRQGKQPHRK